MILLHICSFIVCFSLQHGTLQMFVKPSGNEYNPSETFLYQWTPSVVLLNPVYMKAINQLSLKKSMVSFRCALETVEPHEFPYVFVKLL